MNWWSYVILILAVRFFSSRGVFVTLLLSKLNAKAFGCRYKTLRIGRQWEWERAIEFARWQHPAVERGARFSCAWLRLLSNVFFSALCRRVLRWIDFGKTSSGLKINFNCSRRVSVPMLVVLCKCYYYYYYCYYYCYYSHYITTLFPQSIFARRAATQAPPRCTK